MVASGVLERNAGEKAAPKKMARSRSTRRDARTATRRLASEPSAEVAPPPSSRTQSALAQLPARSQEARGAGGR